MATYRYRAKNLAKGSFPEGMDRDALQAMLEASVEGDTLGMNARRTERGVELSYASVVLTAVKRRLSPQYIAGPSAGRGFQCD